MSDWFRDGVKIESIPVGDRAVQYGDGVFETIAVRDARPRFWGLHMQRLRHACERLGLRLPAESLLERDFQRALAQTTVNTGFCVAKIVVTAGRSPRGYRRDPTANAITLVGVFDAEPLDRSAYTDGVSTILCATHISEQPALAGIKTLNRLDQVMARREWDSPAVFEGLMCDGNDRLVCGTASNVFLIRNNAILTPALTRCGVAGVMRQEILNRLEENQIRCEQTDLRLEELKTVDEVFLSNSQIGVVPVRRCGEQQWPIGEGTRSVMAMMSYDNVPECRL